MPAAKGSRVDSQQSINRGKQDHRYHSVTEELGLPIRLLVLHDGRPPHKQVQNLVEKALAKVNGIVTNDLSKAVHVWAGKLIAAYKYNTLKEMKVYIYLLLIYVNGPRAAYFINNHLLNIFFLN